MEFFGCPWQDGAQSVTALRSVLMKPEHRARVPELLGLLDRSTAADERVGRP